MAGTDRIIDYTKIEKSLYAILEIEKDANPEQIKEAHSKLALRYHPDKNPNNPKAVEKFKEIGQAYSILSDDELKKIYDSYGSVGVTFAKQCGKDKIWIYEYTQSESKMCCFLLLCFLTGCCFCCCCFFCCCCCCGKLRRDEDDSTKDEEETPLSKAEAYNETSLDNPIASGTDNSSKPIVLGEMDKPDDVIATQPTNSC